VLVPRRDDGGRRDEIWAWVRKWMETHHEDYEIFEGYDDHEVFSMATARNNAARAAGDWDVAVILDSDTLAEPDVLIDAVTRASMSTRMIIAGDIRICMDKRSTDNTLESGAPWFPRPEGHLPKNGFGVNDAIYGEPSSGVVVVSRQLWDAMGGYLECLQGWGFEDNILLTCANIFGDGVMWLPGTIYHLWHEPSRRTADTSRNYEIWQNLDRLGRTANKQTVAREYLGRLGHTWPK